MTTETIRVEIHRIVAAIAKLCAVGMAFPALAETEFPSDPFTDDLISYFRE